MLVPFQIGLVWSWITRYPDPSTLTYQDMKSKPPASTAPPPTPAKSMVVNITTMAGDRRMFLGDSVGFVTGSACPRCRCFRNLNVKNRNSMDFEQYSRNSLRKFQVAWNEKNSQFVKGIQYFANRNEFQQSHCI
jgi:hypothetical protein